jgi:hypothetical protein
LQDARSRAKPHESGTHAAAVAAEDLKRQRRRPRSGFQSRTAALAKMEHLTSSTHLNMGDGLV